MIKPNNLVKNNDLIFQGTLTETYLIYKNFHPSLLAFRVDGLKNKLKIIKILGLTSLTNDAELGHSEAAASVKKPTKPGRNLTHPKPYICAAA